MKNGITSYTLITKIKAIFATAVLLLTTISAAMLSGCGNNSDTTQSVGEEISTQEQGASTEEVNTEDLDTEGKNTADADANASQMEHTTDSYEVVQKFGVDLLAQSSGETNPVLSPASAYLALTMAGLGAEGTTLEEFVNVLGEDMMHLSDDMMNRFPQSSETVEVSVLNSAWIDGRFTLKTEWENDIKSIMDAEIYNVELSAISTMKDMNQWISDGTNGLIDLFLTEPFTEVDKMVLINTVYFNGDWETPFDAEATKKEQFKKENGETVFVDMMCMEEGQVDYFQGPHIEGVMLPYANSDLAFIAIKSTDGIKARDLFADRILALENMTEILENKQEGTQMNLHLPKFEITFDRILNKDLENLGIIQAFGEEAEFSKMGTTDSGENIFISQVRQKAMIRVDEEGTEAAAATNVMISKESAMNDETMNVYFDQPFIYMIIDTETNVPLFLGIMDDPAVS